MSSQDKDSARILQMPPWEETVSLMFGKGYPNGAVKSLYNAGRSVRCVYLRNHHGFYMYAFEKLCAFDEDELKYFERTEPGYWEELYRSGYYDSLEAAERESKCDENYSIYFYKK